MPETFAVPMPVVLLAGFVALLVGVCVTDGGIRDGRRDRLVTGAGVIAGGVALLGWLALSSLLPPKVKDVARFDLVNVTWPDETTSQMWTEGDGKHYNATSRFQRVVEPDQWQVVRTTYETAYAGISYGGVSTVAARYTLERKVTAGR